jgi:predicted GH43/DUF377 family glycosyl hydrolase
MASRPEIGEDREKKEVIGLLRMHIALEGEKVGLYEKTVRDIKSSPVIHLLHTLRLDSRKHIEICQAVIEVLEGQDWLPPDKKELVEHLECHVNAEKEALGRANRILENAWIQNTSVLKELMESLRNDEVGRYNTLKDLGIRAIQGATHAHRDKMLHITLERHPLNPLITPRPGLGWEEKGTLNPGGVFESGVFHIFYRAFSSQNKSSIGYCAISSDLRMIERPDHPIMAPEYEWEEHGCEDPRVTKIGDTYYMTYTAYSRRGPRIALASSSDLKTFKKIGVIGPDLDDKDAVLFPEVIDGKIVLLHRIEPAMQLAYFDHSKFEKMSDPQVRSEYWTEYSLQHLSNPNAYALMKPTEWWEEKKLGAGPPPIKTPKGWLIIYHGVDNSLVYRAGAALADLKNPSSIIAKSKNPILEPKEFYEMSGFVRRVVFPEAAMIQDGVLYVFYGGGDSVSCLATAPLNEVINSLQKI